MIKVTHLEDKGIYHFKLPHGTWHVNGKQITVEGYSGQEMTSDIVPLISKISTHLVLREYESEDGSNMSTERFNAEVQDLRAKGYEDEDEDSGWGFADLDAEYAYKRFMRTWKPQHDRVTTETIEELEITHAMYESGSKYIRPLFCVDTSKPNLVHFSKALLQRDTFIAWCLEAKKEHKIPNHSHLRFAKVEGQYVFNGQQEKEFDGTHPILTVTLEEAKRMEKEVVKSITSILNSRYINMSQLETHTVSKVLAALEAAKAVGASGKYSTKKSKVSVIDDMIKDINKAVGMLKDACESNHE